VNRELRRQLPPGPRAPAALQLLGTWTRPTATLRRMRRYGKRVTVQLPFQPPFVVLSDPADVKELFTAPPDAVHPGEGARILEPVVGRNSVILLDEQAHLSQRRLMLPAFQGERMKALRGVMTEQAEQEVESWPTDTPFALHARLQKVTLEIILRAVFGLERGRRSTELRDLMTEVLAFGESPISVLPAMQRVLGWTATQRRFQDRLRRQPRHVSDHDRSGRQRAEDQPGSSHQRTLHGRQPRASALPCHLPPHGAVVLHRAAAWDDRGIARRTIGRALCLDRGHRLLHQHLHPESPTGEADRLGFDAGADRRSPQ